MVNNDKFALRLKEVLTYYQLSASAFADKIKVQRSSISHLLSGRNKPSLDFVLKVLKEFEEVELYWLLNGRGTFPKQKAKEGFPSTLFDEKSPDSLTMKKTATKNNSDSKQIERIIIFYSDGSFSEYFN